jgi:hypothetical protein
MYRIGLGFVIAVCAEVFPAASFAQEAPDLRKPAGKEWLMIGGDWHNTRYSTLTQINGNNVKNLSWTLANFRAPETAISQAFRMLPRIFLRFWARPGPIK